MCVSNVTNVSDGHVLGRCLLCHEKGHCCEICGSDERLFLWEEDRIAQCSSCGALSHKECAAAACGKDCRKCVRIRRVRGDRAAPVFRGSSNFGRELPGTAASWDSDDEVLLDSLLPMSPTAGQAKIENALM